MHSAQLSGTGRIREANALSERLGLRLRELHPQPKRVRRLVHATYGPFTKPRAHSFSQPSIYKKIHVVRLMNTLQLPLVEKGRTEVQVQYWASLRDRRPQEILLGALLLFHQAVRRQYRQRWARLSICRLRRNRFGEGRSERRPWGRRGREHHEGRRYRVAERGLQVAAGRQGGRC